MSVFYFSFTFDKTIPDLNLRLVTRERERGSGNTSHQGLVSFLSTLFVEEKKNALDTQIFSSKSLHFLFQTRFSTRMA